MCRNTSQEVFAHYTAHIRIPVQKREQDPRFTLSVQEVRIAVQVRQVEDALDRRGIILPVWRDYTEG